jgi:hypothetical protein
MTGENNFPVERNPDGTFKQGYTLEYDPRDHSKYINKRKEIADNKYSNLYFDGLTDKEIANRTNSGLSAVQSWRWRRKLSPNHPVNMTGRNEDGTFKPKRVKGSRDVYTHSRDGLKKWKYNILNRDSFTCQLCGSENNLEVHHNKEKFLSILDRFLPERELEKGLSWEEKKIISNKIIEYHYTNNVSGITLCSNCHKNIHRGD